MSVQARGSLVREGPSECTTSIHILLVQTNGILTNFNQVLNVTNLINGLSGTVEIKCSTSEGTTSCQFLQTTIRNAFGYSGLQLNDCIFGECVRQNVIDFLTSGGINSASTNTSSDRTHLSGGIITGLAIVGGLVFLGLLLDSTPSSPFVGWATDAWR